MSTQNQPQANRDLNQVLLLVCPGSLGHPLDMRAVWTFEAFASRHLSGVFNAIALSDAVVCNCRDP